MISRDKAETAVITNTAVQYKVITRDDECSEIFKLIRRWIFFDAMFY